MVSLVTNELLLQTSEACWLLRYNLLKCQENVCGFLIKLHFLLTTNQFICGGKKVDKYADSRFFNYV